MSSKVLLKVSDLCTDFDTEYGRLTAVDEVSFLVRENEIVGLVGESGCGKSVTAETIMRLHDERTTSYRGTIEFDGRDILAVSEPKMREIRGGGLGMIFQDPMNSLNPVFTVGNQLVEATRTHRKCSRREAREQSIALLRSTGIPSPEVRMGEYPHQLSGGMKQRVMIAMALSSNPTLLIADEPTTALDVTTQAQILDLIEKQRDEHGLGAILITHDLGVVAELCDRVVVMYLGQIVEEGTVSEVFDSPKHPYTRGLLESTPSLDADPDEKLSVIPGRVPTLSSIPSGCRFANRCRWATATCSEQRIPLVETGPGRVARCIRIEEIAQSENDLAKKSGISGGGPPNEH